MSPAVTLVETPRDAFQGLPRLIPSAEKVAYLQALLQAGFRHLDAGSFVSPKAVPQMADTEEVLKGLGPVPGVELIALVVNAKGVERALEVDGLGTLAFPFSCSDRFQLLNTRKGIEESWPLVESLVRQVEAAGLRFLLYLSMAFGNPYGDPWSQEALASFIRRLSSLGIRHISLADTVGLADPEQVRAVFEWARAAAPEVAWSAHLHARPGRWQEAVDAAWSAGCRCFDGAVGGLGGCPFAQDHLVSNLPSEELAARFEAQGHSTGLDLNRLAHCAGLAARIKEQYGPQSCTGGSAKP